jgi:hypothetical protein
MCSGKRRGEKKRDIDVVSAGESFLKTFLLKT